MNPASTTIVAPATPPGKSAIAVVRLSGSRAIEITDGLVDQKHDWQSHKATVHYLTDPDGKLLDQALVIPFLAPNSYTGEDLVEFQTHGNPVLVARLVELLLAAGATPADEGAFTRRAVLNGKMGLPEAEALAELIDATNPVGAHQVLSRLKGALRTWSETTRKTLIEIQAQLVAYIDFPDEAIEPQSIDALCRSITELATFISKQADRAANARIWVHGARIAIIGPPNAGKSTLLNCLLGEERALVSPWAGTTRDYLEAGMTLAGVPIRLIDTAGIHETDDVLELKGIERATSQADEADLVLILQAPDAELAPGFNITCDNTIHVWNKSDLSEGPSDMIQISAEHKSGIDQLTEVIVASLDPGTDIPVVSSIRQEQACRLATTSLETAAEKLQEGFPPEIAAEELHSANVQLDALLGIIDPEDILDQLFSSFCIGK